MKALPDLDPAVSAATAQAAGRFAETRFVRRKLRQETLAKWIFFSMAAAMILPLILIVGYLIARAWFSRKLRWILTAAAVLLLFGTLLGRLLPTFHSTQTWQAHACGFGAGIVAGAALHAGEWRRRRARRASRRRASANRAPGPPVS